MLKLAQTECLIKTKSFDEGDVKYLEEYLESFTVKQDEVYLRALYLKALSNYDCTNSDHAVTINYLRYASNLLGELQLGQREKLGWLFRIGNLCISIGSTETAATCFKQAYTMLKQVYAQKRGRKL